MKIELRNLSEIKSYPQNPRVNDAAVDAAAAEIHEFDFSAARAARGGDNRFHTHRASSAESATYQFKGARPGSHSGGGAGGAFRGR
jgi:hypothetical protein